MDQRTPLEMNTVLDFGGLTCHIESVVGQGSNAIVYKGWYSDSLDREQRHHVLVKELFPFHPQQKIRRTENGCITAEPEAEELWKTHKESFEIGNRIHLRLLSDHPDLMTMGANLNSFCHQGTLYSVLGYTGGRSLQAELKQAKLELRRLTRRMIGLLDALEAFHKSGYLHLDISPDNVMLVGHGEQERIFLIDYNSARALDSREQTYFSCKAGYSAPEVSTGDLAGIGFASDLYSVAAVFYRCLMDRSLTLAETLRPKAPDGHDSPLLREATQTVISMVSSILRKGLHTLAKRRYQTIGQMREAFQELLDRIDCVGVTRWALWENGKRSVEELIRVNPALRYLQDADKLYPIRLEGEYSMSLEEYLTHMLAQDGASGMIIGQGGVGKTTLLLHMARLRGERYSPMEPAVFYISFNGWNGTDTQYIRRQILLRLRFRQEENTFDGAMHTLQRLLEQPQKTKTGDLPTVLLLLDGLNEVHGDITPLVQEIHALKRMAGVRIAAASRSEIPELELETVRLMPLQERDIAEALGRNGLLIPRSLEVVELLRTPLILSIYIQTSDGGRQLDIRSEEELMKAYMDALLQKELRLLPEDSPRRWQIDAALNYILPAIAIQTRRKGRSLTREQLLKTMEQLWASMDSRAFRKAFSQWNGYHADIRADQSSIDGWYKLMLHTILWQHLGMLIKDEETGGYRVFHQKVEEYLAGYEIPMVNRRRWIVVAALLLCGMLLFGYRQYREAQERIAQQARAAQQEAAARSSVEKAMELGASAYAEYGGLYRQLREVVDLAQAGDTGQFLEKYGSVYTALLQEKQKTDSEFAETRVITESAAYSDTFIAWGDRKLDYEYDILCELFRYPDDRAVLYAEYLPSLKTWMEMEELQVQTPMFAEALSGLLEADARLAAEHYHRSVGLHLSGGDPVWREQINGLIAMVGELDAHRDTAVRDDRELLLETLRREYHEADSTFNEEYAKLNAYLKNLTSALWTEEKDMQELLEQISADLKENGAMAEAEKIDEVVTTLTERQSLTQSIVSHFDHTLQEGTEGAYE